MTFHQEAYGAESRLHHTKCCIQCSKGGCLGWASADRASSLQCSFGVFLGEAESHPPLTFLQTVASLEQVGTGRYVALVDCSGFKNQPGTLHQCHMPSAFPGGALWLLHEPTAGECGVLTGSGRAAVLPPLLFGKKDVELGHLLSCS